MDAQTGVGTEAVAVVVVGAKTEGSRGRERAAGRIVPGGGRHRWGSVGFLYKLNFYFIFWVGEGTGW